KPSETLLAPSPRQLPTNNHLDPRRHVCVGCACPMRPASRGLGRLEPGPSARALESSDFDDSSRADGGWAHHLLGSVWMMYARKNKRTLGLGAIAAGLSLLAIGACGEADGNDGDCVSNERFFQERVQTTLTAKCAA